MKDFWRLFMREEDRRLFIESIAEMRELKGELKEFKEHIVGRIERLESNEGTRFQRYVTVVSVIIAAAAFILSVFTKCAK
jgi:hypothetical protein